MKVRFISHASILVQCQNRTILSDPWLQSKVFNNGWALVSPAYQPNFSSVDYIWISHEHPDHFNFPSLKAIPHADKARIKVLYQRHASPRIVEALRNLGFKHIIELPLYKWFRLEHGLEVFCGSAGYMDSFIAIRDDKECLLNFNDCVFNIDQLRYIKRRIGKVSLLFTQFSFANWVGNDGDEARGAEHKIEQLKNQITIFQPEFTVPFASFVYFCNEENCRMNAWVNTPDTIAQLNIPGVNFMYPGDEWSSDTRTLNSQNALERYRLDYANIQIDPTPEAVDIARISEAIKKRLEETKSKVPKRFLRKLPQFVMYIHDLNKVVEVDPARDVYQIMEGDEQHIQMARYVVCSQVAWYAFAFSWGGNTTQISGMYLDRQFAQCGWSQGWNPFFWLQTKLSTEVLRFTDIKAVMRTINFWWGKKGEKFFQYTGTLKGQVMVDE